LKSLDIDKVPVLVQYNKRDLPDAVPLETADKFGDPGRKLESACAKQGEGVVPTFFELVGKSWDYLDRDLKLAEKLGIDSTAFRKALAEHVGVTP
jgi:signal recognition particle receptor subunit beta